VRVPRCAPPHHCGARVCFCPCARNPAIAFDDYPVAVIFDNLAAEHTLKDSADGHPGYSGTDLFTPTLLFLGTAIAFGGFSCSLFLG